MAVHGAATDEVDRIVAGWQRERPDLDVSPLEVMSRLSRLARHLEAARSEAFKSFGLEQWSFDVLAALRRQGGRYELTPGELLRETMVTSGTMTNRVDRLVSAGLVTRRPDAADRRSVRVRLTAAGRRRIDGCFADLVAREQVLLRTLSHGRRVSLAGGLREMLVGFEAGEG